MRLPRSLTFSIAIIASLGAAITVRKAIVAKPQLPVVARTSTIELLVAARPLAAGAHIKTSDLRWKSWPESAAPIGAVIRNRGRSLNDFENSYVRYPLIEGELIAEAKLVWPGKGSYAAALIEKGMRAVAVSVREESAVGGLIQPHDRVDVLWTGNGDRNADRQPKAQILLRSVRVLAIGNSVNAGTARSDNGTATLELTPDQARILAGARISGEISLILIPSADEKTTSMLPEKALSKTRVTSVRIMKFGRGTAGYLGRNPQ